MPKITKQFTLEITPERYIDACSGDEIYELWLLLSNPKYKGVIARQDTVEKLKKAYKPKKKKKKVELPFSGTAFEAAWQEWKEYKAKEHGFKFKSAISERKALKRLQTDSGNNEQRAIAIINRSIEHGWSGLFPLPAGYLPRVNKTQRKDFK